MRPADVAVSMSQACNGEAWAPVPGFPRYEVSDRGRVRSVNTRGQRNTVAATALNPWRANKDGYLRVGVWNSNGRSLRYVHRLVLRAHVGEPAQGQEAMHLDSDVTNNRLSNLAWGDHRENCRHRKERRFG